MDVGLLLVIGFMFGMLAFAMHEYRKLHEEYKAMMEASIKREREYIDWLHSLHEKRKKHDNVIPISRERPS